MSDCWKCDKCGEYFNFETEKPYEVRAYDGNTRYGACAHETYDLCEKCKSRFDKWIETKPLYGTDFTFNIIDEIQEYTDDLVYQHPKREPVPRVYFGNVHPFPNSNLNDKEFPKKMLEEAAEVYSAWEDYLEAVARDDEDEIMDSLEHITLECGDVVQTCANMLRAAQKTAQEIRPLFYNINVYDAQALMLDIEKRNRERGRYDA